MLQLSWGQWTCNLFHFWLIKIFEGKCQLWSIESNLWTTKTSWIFWIFENFLLGSSQSIMRLPKVHEGRSKKDHTFVTTETWQILHVLVHLTLTLPVKLPSTFKLQEKCTNCKCCGSTFYEVVMPNSKFIASLIHIQNVY